MVELYSGKVGKIFIFELLGSLNLGQHVLKTQIMPLSYCNSIQGSKNKLPRAGCTVLSSAGRVSGDHLQIAIPQNDAENKNQ